MQKIKHVVENPLTPSLKYDFHKNELNKNELNFLVCSPVYLHNKIKNNVFMEERQGLVDNKEAVDQWMRIIDFLRNKGKVHEIKAVKGLQDQSFVENLGVVLSKKGEDYYVLSNFRSLPRIREPQAAVDTLHRLGFNIVQNPYFFEGEADLRKIKDRLYIGGYNIRTEYNALKWISEYFKVKIIPVFMDDPRRYHLDGITFPIDSKNVAVCKSSIYKNSNNKKAIKGLEKHVNVIDVDSDDYIIPASHIIDDTIIYGYINKKKEAKSVKKLNKIADITNKKLKGFNISAFALNGGGVSCLVNNLNP